MSVAMPPTLEMPHRSISVVALQYDSPYVGQIGGQNSETDFYSGSTWDFGEPSNPERRIELLNYSLRVNCPALCLADTKHNETNRLFMRQIVVL